MAAHGDLRRYIGPVIGIRSFLGAPPRASCPPQARYRPHCAPRSCGPDLSDAPLSSELRSPTFPASLKAILPGFPSPHVFARAPIRYILRLVNRRLPAGRVLLKPGMSRWYHATDWAGTSLRMKPALIGFLTAAWERSRPSLDWDRCAHRKCPDRTVCRNRRAKPKYSLRGSNGVSA